MSSSVGFVVMPPFTASSASACLLPLSSKPSRSSKHGRRRLSCKAMAGAGDDDQVVRVDRRDVLLGLTAATTLGRALAAEGKQPITSEVLKCVPAADFRCPAGANDYDAAKVVNFSDLPPPTGPPRVRRPAHLLEDHEVANFEKALRKMKALPDDDPLSFKNQAAIHEAYCDGKYNLQLSPDADDPDTFDVHFSSIFAPWHRMYIYFFEGILGSLINDPTFGLPYWNWDAPAGMMLPAAFANRKSPLYHENRKPENERAFIDLSLSPQAKSDPNKFKDDLLGLIDSNLCAMYRQMNAKEPVDFHGSYFSPSRSTTKPLVGSLEMGAHTAAHIWVGKDMGNLRTAARDPVFYSNHSNVDRMWHLWTTKLGNQDDMDDKQWLDTSFVFYNKDRQPVRIAVRDVLKPSKLGYTYEDKKSIEWMERRIKPADIKIDDDTAARNTSSLPLALKRGKLEYVAVERPKKGAGGKTEEELVVDVMVDPCEQVKFDVLVNVPKGEEGKVGPQNSQFAGSFSTVPHGTMGAATAMDFAKPKPVVSTRFKLRELIQDLNCSRNKKLKITIIPVEGDKTVIDNLRVELC